jgi:hypothetical protein
MLHANPVRSTVITNNVHFGGLDVNHLAKAGGLTRERDRIRGVSGGIGNG